MEVTTAYQIMAIYFSIVLCVQNKIEVVQFTRISVKHITSLSCGVSCARDPQCSGYLVTAVYECTMVTDGDIETVCFSASVSTACYRRNGDITTQQPSSQTTLVPVTTQTSHLVDTTLESLLMSTTQPMQITTQQPHLEDTTPPSNHLQKAVLNP